MAGRVLAYTSRRGYSDPALTVLHRYSRGRMEIFFHAVHHPCFCNLYEKLTPCLRSEHWDKGSNGTDQPSAAPTFRLAIRSNHSFVLSSRHLDYKSQLYIPLPTGRYLRQRSDLFLSHKRALSAGLFALLAKAHLVAPYFLPHSEHGSSVFIIIFSLTPCITTNCTFPSCIS